MRKIRLTIQNLLLITLSAFIILTLTIGTVWLAKKQADFLSREIKGMGYWYRVAVSKLPLSLIFAPKPPPPPPVEEKKAVVAEPTYTPPRYSSPFQWGATMRPNAYTGYTVDSWQAQISKAKELGLGWARINYVYNQANPIVFNAKIIDALKSNGMDVLMVIEHNPALGTGDMYQDGLRDGRTIGAAYQGKVQYYQLANEGGAQSIKSGTLEGIRTSDYDDGQYAIVRDYIKGLSEGLDQTDPDARRIVTISWMHTGFLDRLVRDGIGFDMIGIDWYSWMGNFGSRSIGNGQTLYGKLKSFGKPLIFAEVNAWPQGESINEQASADFISSTARWARNNSAYVKGFYAYELIDNVSAPGIYKYFGLVKAERGSMGAPRPAFNALRDIIQ